MALRVYKAIALSNFITDYAGAWLFTILMRHPVVQSDVEIL